MITEDKGKKENYDQSDLMGIKPYGNIGPGRTAEESALVKKLKKKKKNEIRAEGSTEQSGEEANAGLVSGSIGKFVNRV